MKIPQLYDLFREKWEHYNNIFLISDTHFGDKELYVGTKHLLRADNESYVQVLNSWLGKNDLLIHLGDVGEISTISRIRAGHKVLIMGNHDSGASNYKRQIHKEIFTGDRKQIIQIMKEKYPNHSISVSDTCYDVQHAPFEYYEAYADSKLFDEVYEGPLIIGEKLILSHEPINITGMMNIHGHIHDPKSKNDSNHFNICPDATHIFTPVSLGTLIKQGLLSDVKTLHRETINKATKRNRRKRRCIL